MKWTYFHFNYLVQINTDEIILVVLAAIIGLSIITASIYYRNILRDDINNIKIAIK